MRILFNPGHLQNIEKLLRQIIHQSKTATSIFYVYIFYIVIDGPTYYTISF